MFHSSMAEDLADGMKMWSLSALPWRTVAVFERPVDKAPVESTGDWSFMDVNGSLVGC